MDNYNYPCPYDDGQMVTSWYDPDRRGTWIQHGDNPEHRRFFSDALAAVNARALAIIEWGDELHTADTRHR